MIVRVLTELIYWLHSQIVGGRGQIVHGDVSSPSDFRVKQETRERVLIYTLLGRVACHEGTDLA